MRIKLIVAILAASAMTFTGCSSSSKTDADSESLQSESESSVDKYGKKAGSTKITNAFEDSVAILTGRYSSAELLRAITNLPEEQRAKISKKAFVKGMELVINADTATIGDYVAGMQVGMQQMNSFMQMYGAGINVDRQAFMDAFEKGFMAENVTDAEFEKIQKEMGPMQEKLTALMMAEHQKQMSARHKTQDKQFEKNKKEGLDFMTKLKADKNVKVTQSGLAYKVKKMGTGGVAKKNDSVKVKYVGKTINGKEFDSSNGQEVSFRTDAVIPGFAEALTTFPAGTEVTLYIPEDLAYGRNGQGAIEPGSLLIFELRIGEVEK